MDVVSNTVTCEFLILKVLPDGLLRAGGSRDCVEDSDRASL